MKLSKQLREEYQELWDTMFIRTPKLSMVEKRLSIINKNKDHYVKASIKTGVPWLFIAGIHSMESTCSFEKHLHNGDPLTGRTKKVPAGRPITPNPPYTWEVSAADALHLKGLDKVSNWDLIEILFRQEDYNGWGYRLYHPEVKSPYLWSFSTHYLAGKYIGDNKYKHDSVSQQIGTACLLKQYVISHPINNLSISKGPDFISANVVEYQKFLNDFGFKLVVDGKAGNKTCKAYRSVFGKPMNGDTDG